MEDPEEDPDFNVSDVDEIRETRDTMKELIGLTMIREESKEESMTTRGSEITNRGSETSTGLNVTSLLLGESIMLSH